MQKLDHGTIFVMIAGSYTPLCLLVLDGWVAARCSPSPGRAPSPASCCLRRPRPRPRASPRRPVHLLGWASVVAAPQLLGRLSITQLVLIAVGGVLFTVGAMLLLTNWPDPFPRVFGYHEVWHVLVVAAVVVPLRGHLLGGRRPARCLMLADDVDALDRGRASTTRTPPDATDRLAAAPLQSRGARDRLDEEQLVRRTAEGTVSRAVVDRGARRGAPLHAARRPRPAPGSPPSLLVRVWLALGFPPPAEGEPDLQRRRPRAPRRVQRRARRLRARRRCSSPASWARRSPGSARRPCRASSSTSRDRS